MFLCLTMYFPPAIMRTMGRLYPYIAVLMLLLAGRSVQGFNVDRVAAEAQRSAVLVAEASESSARDRGSSCIRPSYRDGNHDLVLERAVKKISPPFLSGAGTLICEWAGDATLTAPGEPASNDRTLLAQGARLQI